jgi:hypothetical protein
MLLNPASDTRILSTRDLTPVERRLVHALQRVVNGSLENCEIAQGQIRLDPWPVTIRDVRFGPGSPRMVTASSADFDLKAQLIELIRCIRSVESGLIRSLRIRGGLPAGMELILTDGAATNLGPANTGRADAE